METDTHRLELTRIFGNMKKTANVLLIHFSLLLLSCGTEKAPGEAVATEKAPPSEVRVESDFDGPPFNDTCLCNFGEFGDYKISEDNYNIYNRGKGWNPAYYSCSWTWWGPARWLSGSATSGFSP